MSKKLRLQITQGLVKSRMAEKKVDMSIKKMQQSQRKLLYEIKNLLDSNNDDDALLLAKELAQSRSSIKQLGKMKFYFRGIQFFFKNAQSNMVKGESMDEIAHVLTRVNNLMSAENLDQTFMAVENEMESLDLNMEQVDYSLESLDEPLDEDEYADQIINELKTTNSESIGPKINEMVNLTKLLPSIPKFDQELKDDTDDFEEFEDKQ